MVRIAVLLLLATLVGGSLLAWEFLGWWALLAVPVALYLLAKSLGGWLLRQLFMAPFRAKGAVLRGATATVHSLAPCPAPPPPAEGEEGAAAEPGEPPVERRWFRLEATIAPAGEAAGPFRHWEPGEIRLAPPEVSPEDTDDGACEVREVEVEGESGAFGPDEGMKYAGPLRVRLLLGVRPGTGSLSFRYYIEKFGEVRLAG